MASIGAHIKRLRTSKHMTQEELAEKLFVTRQTVSAWENGKAQPDVDTLERIAAALGTEVTDVLYGTRLTPPLEILRQKWLHGLIWGFLLSRLVFILLYEGYWDSWSKGLAYHFSDPRYLVHVTELTENYSLELDMTDPYSNEGKVLYEDDNGCRIVVSSINWNSDGTGAWDIWFTTEGTCSQRGGTIVSAMMRDSHGLNSIHQYTTDQTSTLTVTTDDFSQQAIPLGDTFVFSRLGENSQKNFGYTLFYGEEDPSTLPENITITFDGLMKFTTHWIS